MMNAPPRKTINLRSRAAALIVVASLAVRADEAHYGEGSEYHDHHYGDGSVPAHDSYRSEYANGSEDYHYHDHHHGDDYRDHHYYAYGAGDPSNYNTHGSLVLTSLEDLEEFRSMDLLETAVVAVFSGFPELEAVNTEDMDLDSRAAAEAASEAVLEALERDGQFMSYKELAGDHSHLFRFAHTTSPKVAEALGLAQGGAATGAVQSAAVLVLPAALLAKNHPRAGGWLQFPGASLSVGSSLQTWLFMESSPLVGAYDWRSVQRAEAVDLPTLTVFGDLAAGSEMHHTYHTEAAEEAGVGHEEEEEGAASSTSEKSFKGGAGRGAGGSGNEFDLQKAAEEGRGGSGDTGSGAGGGWTFDSMSDALRPVGLAWRHDLHLLVASKVTHSYEMHSYHLDVPEHDARAVGLGLKHGERYYKREFTLPESHETADAAAVLAQETQALIELYFDGKLVPVADGQL